MTRPDLLALTEDGLIALTNRGLVKRAARETSVTLDVSADGTVQARFPDGVESVLPPDVALSGASCSCGAAGICRHRIAVVLAYQRDFAAAPTFTPWSPGDLTDDVLVEAFGQRTLSAARKTYLQGYPVKLRHPMAEDPVAVAELPLCTVRFLVPGELGYVHTDVTAARRNEFIVLAVWAFREAGAVLEFEAGGGSSAREDFADALDLVDQLLADGAVNASPVQEAALRRAHRDLADRNLHWPAAALSDLIDQVAAYRSRHASYDPARFAALITELHARHRSTGPRSQVLGTDERSETPLTRVRLTALGCCLRDEHTAEVYFAGPTTVLVLRHRWESATANRRVAGTTLGRLASSNVVSESAVRSASRVVRLTTSRVSKTSVTPVGDAWADLPDTILVRDFAALDRQLAALPPSFTRARVEADLVRVLAVAEVHSVAYDPGSQRLDAVIVDADGTTATVSAHYNPCCPASLDVLASALTESPRMIAGSVRRVRGSLVVDPYAVLTATGVVVPAVAPGTPTQLASPEWSADFADPVSAAISSALDVTAEAAHRGLQHLTPGLLTRLTQAANGLRRVGLGTAADLVDAVPTSWPAAHLRLLALAELTPA